jgi:two-component system, OmpR family, phosphate regulon response regulator PhoB
MASAAAVVQVLVVEDEVGIAELISLNLRHAGWDPVVVGSAEAARLHVREQLPALAVVDWMLPGMSGPALIRHWRADARTRHLPLLMLTARAEESDLVAGLEAGADDYLTKPFSTRELVARIRALLRRVAPQALSETVRLGALQLQPSQRQLSWTDPAGTRDLRIGPAEFRLLHFFMTHPSRVFSRSQLLDKVWGDHVFIEERTVDVHVKRLRSVLSEVGADTALETVRGAGYRMNVPSAAAGGTP